VDALTRLSRWASSAAERIADIALSNQFFGSAGTVDILEDLNTGLRQLLD
jgi:hypothetical protein